MFPTRINTGRPRIGLSYSHLRDTAIATVLEPVILSPSLGRRISGDACDRNVDGEVPLPMPPGLSGGKAVARAIESEISREILRPKEGPRMTASEFGGRRQSK